MNIFINADDFGLTRGVTDGIIQAYQNGIVHATTLMMNGRAVPYAVQQAKRFPQLQVGIHLVLSYGRPLTTTTTLTNASGHFRFTNQYAEQVPPSQEDVLTEWTAQIEAFLATGLPLHHLDSHHHIHGWEPLQEVVLELARRYGVPVRFAPTLAAHPDYLLTDTLYTGFYGEGIYRDLWEELRLLDSNSIEVMVHPAYVDADLRDISSYTTQREEELALLTRLTLPDDMTFLSR
ncbi:chitin disaccharide deacetylase [Exiguobacterium antarcticum]|uniref:Chitin disaccharide deacetylase n=1 Tax=Exiguobacterium antarcticum TaxID=132920 RepID=A0ABT6R362_9BACL|nr:chitin disaccharide deacetylase [Exiguobacterium antarcticum]MDI3235212.1 chitin disaccharide deacetylase [Exiguobacterium antarcticum]